MKRHPALLFVRLADEAIAAVARMREPRCVRCGCTRSKPCPISWDGGSGVCADLSKLGYPGLCSNCIT